MNLDRRQIVLIVGAGCSKDLHQQFGLGHELLQHIIERVTDSTSPDNPYLSKLLSTHFQSQILETFVNDLIKYRSSVETPSIDGFIDEVSTYPEYIDVRDEYVKIAKFAIMFHILGYEAELYREHKITLPDNCWINRVARFIDENNVLNDVPYYPDLKIITFNYDRNIEHYLFHHERFKNRKKEIKTFIQNSIFHVYGNVGALEWQDEADYFEFGEPNNQGEKIFRTKNAITLMYRERQEAVSASNPGADWIHSHRNTSFIAIAGFSFDLVNYRLLYLPTLDLKGNDIKLVANIFTIKGGDFTKRREMTERIRNVKHNAELTFYTCTDFFDDILSRSIY